MAVVGRASVTITADVTKFADQLEKALNRALKQAKLDTSGISKRIKDAFDDGADEAKRALDSINKANTFAQISRQAADTGDDIGDRISAGVDKAERALAGLTRAALRTTVVFAALTAGTIALLAATAALSAGFAALAAATGAVLNATPALIAGATVLAAVIGTVRVATSGMGDAFAAVAEGDAEALADAMEKLAPSAREVVQAFADFKPVLDEIRASVQEAFFADMAADLTDLGDALAGPVQRGMTILAGQLGEVVRGFLDVGASAESVTFVENVFRSAALAVDQMAAPLANVLEGLIAVADAGLPAFDNFIDGLANATTQFGDFLKLVAEVGFTDALGRVFAPEGIASLLSAMFTRALEFIADVVPQMATAILEGREAFFEAVLQVFSAIVEILPQIVPEILAAIFGLIESIASTLATAAPTIAAGAVTFIQGIVDGIRTALPVVIASAATIIESLITALIAAAPLLIEGAGLLVIGIAQGLADNASMILVGVEQVIEALLTALVTVLPQLVTTGLTLLLAIADGLVAALPRLVKFIAGDLIPSLVDALLDAIPDILDAGVDIIEALVDGVTTAIPQIATLISTVVIPGLVTAITTALPQILAAGVALLQALIQGWVSAETTLLAAAAELIPVIVGAILELLPLWIESGITMITALLTGLIEALPTIIAFVTDMIPVITETIILLLPQLIEAGIEIILALIEGAVSQRVQIVTAIVTEIIPALITALLTAVPKTLASGIKILAGFLTGIKDGWVTARDWIKGIPDRIVDAIGNVSNLLKGIASDIIDGFVQGLRDSFGEVQDALGELTDLMPDWKGPAAVDRRLLSGPAKSIMDGFADDLVDQAARTVMPALSGIGGDITAQVNTAAVGAGTTTLTDTGGDTFIGEATIDLGEGISQVVELKFRRQAAGMKRQLISRAGAAR